MIYKYQNSYGLGSVRQNEEYNTFLHIFWELARQHIFSYLDVSMK